MELKEIIAYIVTASGFCGLIIWLVKFNANTLREIVGQGEDRRKLEHDENIAVQRETASSIRAMGDGFCKSLDKLGERSGNGHQEIAKKIGSLENECQVIKGSVISTGDHVVARLNEWENKNTKFLDDISNEWGKTRDVIRNCDRRRNSIK